MDEPKELTNLNQGDYDYPLADVSHLSEKEKQNLLRRGMYIPKELHSDEEFETASYERGLWYHRNRFNKGGKNICNHLLMSWWNTLPTTRNTTGNTCTNWNKPNFVT